MTVPEKLAALCRRMEEEGVDVYLVPTGDDHSSEYAGDYYNCRAWLTGFTGSAGTADPLDQISSVGWKMDGFGVKLLQPEYAVRIECGFTA